MEMKSAVEVLKGIEETRQQIGSIVMEIDGAQAHFMLESFNEALKTAATLLILANQTDPDDWNSEFGTQAECRETARELGLTGISAMRMFFDALPDNLKAFDKSVSSSKLELIERLFNLFKEA